MSQSNDYSDYGAVIRRFKKWWKSEYGREWDACKDYDGTYIWETSEQQTIKKVLEILERDREYYKDCGEVNFGSLIDEIKRAFNYDINCHNTKNCDKEDGE